ncbi:hypothetical protein APR11_002505 [Nocardia amikacinitolerans]|uniref:hypothetical protein n=1 Tax=Nocardia amikacinitolerans TaxID=756689 RepID=UPI0020A3C690|nr:hypothetical protein [Nocardia amikacinitolerans]MCP2296077.1 hypothetical protein [Nocardia amikacinitolerans]
MTVETVAVGAFGARDAEVLRFRDMHSGYVFHVAPPDAHPDLWRRYLRGALRVYRHYEVDPALEYEKVSDGRSTSLFFAAVDPAGRVVAGLRAQGPYLVEDEVHGLGAWAGRPGEADLRAMIAERIREGIVEVKAVWVARNGIAHRAQLGAAISRCVVHAAWLLGARFGFVTAAAHTARLYESSGGRIAEGVPPVPYPDDRYRTVPLWWDTRAYRANASKLQGSLLALERAALGAWFAQARRLSTAVDVRTGGLAQA